LNKKLQTRFPNKLSLEDCELVNTKCGFVIFDFRHLKYVNPWSFQWLKETSGVGYSKYFASSQPGSIFRKCKKASDFITGYLKVPRVHWYRKFSYFLDNRNTHQMFKE